MATPTGTPSTKVSIDDMEISTQQIGRNATVTNAFLAGCQNWQEK